MDFRLFCCFQQFFLQRLKFIFPVFHVMVLQLHRWLTKGVTVSKPKSHIHYQAMNYSKHKLMTILTLTDSQQTDNHILYELICLSAYSNMKLYLEHVIVFEKKGTT